VTCLSTSVPLYRAGLAQLTVIPPVKVIPCCVGFEVFTVWTMKNAAFCHVALCVFVINVSEECVAYIFKVAEIMRARKSVVELSLVEFSLV
jgi:hypothetical protein